METTPEHQTELMREFIKMLESVKRERQEEIRSAMEMNNDILRSYISGRKDEITVMIGKAYEALYKYKHES